jgi:hypothetical protein
VDKNTPSRKIVIAPGEDPWQGSAYRTAQGNERREYSDLSELINALSQLTGWPMPSPFDD